jgi:hypothetical protein
VVDGQSDFIVAENSGINNGDPGYAVCLTDPVDEQSVNSVYNVHDNLIDVGVAVNANNTSELASLDGIWVTGPDPNDIQLTVNRNEILLVRGQNGIITQNLRAAVIEENAILHQSQSPLLNPIANRAGINVEGGQLNEIRCNYVEGFNDLANNDIFGVLVNTTVNPNIITNETNGTDYGFGFDGDIGNFNFEQNDMAGFSNVRFKTLPNAQSSQWQFDKGNYFLDSDPLLPDYLDLWHDGGGLAIIFHTNPAEIQQQPNSSLISGGAANSMSLFTPLQTAVATNQDCEDLPVLVNSSGGLVNLPPVASLGNALSIALRWLREGNEAPNISGFWNDAETLYAFELARAAIYDFGDESLIDYYQTQIATLQQQEATSENLQLLATHLETLSNIYDARATVAAEKIEEVESLLDDIGFAVDPVDAEKYVHLAYAQRYLTGQVDPIIVQVIEYIANQCTGTYGQGAIKARALLPILNGKLIREHTCTSPLERIQLIDVSDSFVKTAAILTPNPTAEYVKINSESGIASIEVVNAYGQQMLQTTDPYFDTTSWPLGTYFVRMKFESGLIETQALLVIR